jgi:outer membrane protein OmpA-like peptidoglycan-associated protein/tetratricopeptide (TPR) repeat protein
MRIGIFIVLIATLLSVKTGAQNLIIPEDINKKSLKYYEDGLAAVKIKRFDEALILFNKSLEKASDFNAARIMKASVLFETKSFEQAEKEFLTVMSSGQDFPDKVFYTIGLIQWKLDKFGLASENFKKYLKCENIPDILRTKAAKYYNQSVFAEKAVANPLPFEPVNVGDKINTGVNEYLPSITADGKTMVFTRRVGSSEFLFETKLIDGEWSDPRSIDEINQYMESGAHSLSADGKFLVFTSCERQDGYGSCDLYYSANRRGTWTRPRNMGKVINSAAWDSQPSLTENGRTLYFSSNRQGTLGGKDIWVARRNSQGRWTYPVNLGETINSQGDEKAPFIHFDATTLYFMSNYHQGMGDFDLFKSSLSEKMKWSTPENLGYPINTKYHDGTFCVDISGKSGFMTSDRHHKKDLTKDKKAKVETDIYSFEMPPVIAPNASTFLEVTVIDKLSKEPIQAGVNVYRNDTEHSIFRGHTDEEGETLVVLPLKADYAISITADGYAFFSSRVNLLHYDSSEPVKLKVELWKPEETEETPIVLENVLFESGSDRLQPNSQQEISQLYDLLVGQPLIFIEIRGHTDNVGRPEDNLLLSESRAKRVYDVLIKMGIEENRLSFHGFGESKPIAENSSEEGRTLNRRTEFVILKK